MAEQYVNFLSSHAVPRAMTLTELQAETKADRTLQKLVQIIQTGDWNNIQSFSEDVDKSLLKQFANVKAELTVNTESNLVLRGSRIVIPTTLQQKAVEIAHEGHQGIVKTKKLLREKVWFPGIEEKVKVAIQNCIACQANGPGNHPQPLKMSPLPPKPWHTVNVDFCGPFPTGEYLLVVIDAYSRFPEIKIVNSTQGKGTISKLDRIFATHGFPKILKSDNGPPFFGEEFKIYMQENGICHQKITPLWPQANGEAENFMKPLTKAVRSSHAEGRDWRKDLFRFLLNYRATPHSTTGMAPARLLFNRNIVTKLPELDQDYDPPTTAPNIQVKDSLAKQKMKRHADKRDRAHTSEISIGDIVLVRQRKANKFSTKFDPSPYEVVSIKGTMVTAVRNEKYITRNVSLFKRIDESMKGPVEEEKSDIGDEERGDDDMDVEEHGNKGRENARQDPQHISTTEPVTGSSTAGMVPTSRYPIRDKHAFHRYGQNIYEW